MPIHKKEVEFEWNLERQRKNLAERKKKNHTTVLDSHIRLSLATNFCTNINGFEAYHRRCEKTGKSLRVY